MKRHLRLLNLLGGLALLTLSAFTSAQDISQPDGEFRLMPGQRLLPGQTAVSYGGVLSADGSQVVARRVVARLAMQTDGNLVFFTTDPDTLALKNQWHSSTYGNPGAYLEMQADGNLVVYRQDRYPLWASGTNGYGNTAHMRLQSDGNFVVYSRDWLWASGTWHTGEPDSGQPAPTIQRLTRGDVVFSANQRFYVTLQSDHNLVLYRNGGGALWATGNLGDLAVVQTDGNFVLYDGYGQARWASNTQGYGPAVELLMQDDGNLVLYGFKPRWSPASDLNWYQRLCAKIKCEAKYSTTFSAQQPPNEPPPGGAYN